jgi:hypothetical protein
MFSSDILLITSFILSRPVSKRRPDTNGKIALKHPDRAIPAVLDQDHFRAAAAADLHKLCGLVAVRLPTHNHYTEFFACSIASRCLSPVMKHIVSKTVRFVLFTLRFHAFLSQVSRLGRRLGTSSTLFIPVNSG